MTRKTGFEMAEQLSDFLNSATFSEREEFAKAITSDHRALQASFFTSFYNCMDKWAEDYVNGNYDGRNQSACELSYKMIRAVEN